MYALIDPTPGVVFGVAVSGRVLAVAGKPQAAPRPMFALRCADTVTSEYWWDGSELQAPTADMLKAKARPCIMAEAEKRIAAGILVDGKPFKCDNGSVLRMTLLVGGLTAAGPDTTQTFSTEAGDEFTVNAAQAAQIQGGQVDYVGLVLGASSTLQTDPPADPKADECWPARGVVTLAGG
jgi:hypothetical protein